MTDSDRIRSDIPMDELPADVREIAGELDDPYAEAHKCVGCGDWIYTVRYDGVSGAIHAEVNKYGHSAGEFGLHVVYDEYSDPWMPGADGDEYLCDNCHDDLRGGGGLIRARDPQGNRIAFRSKFGVLTHAHYHNHDDGGKPRKHACMDAIEALVRGDEEVPWDAGWYATTDGDREITGEEMVRPIETWERKPHNVPSSYQTREQFIDAIFSGDVDVSTAVVARGSYLWVPEDDVEMVRETYKEYAKGQMPV